MASFRVCSLVRRSGRCRRRKAAQNQGHNRQRKSQEENIHSFTISQPAARADLHGEKRLRLHLNPRHTHLFKGQPRRAS